VSEAIDRDVMGPSGEDIDVAEIAAVLDQQEADEDASQDRGADDEGIAPVPGLE
jgi:hypothetical protein